MRTDMSPTEFLRIAGHTAEHFGFRSLDSLHKEPVCKNCEFPLGHSITADDHLLDKAGGLLARGVTAYCHGNFHALEKPVLFYSIDAANDGSTAISFHIFNVQKSIAEALLIQANRALTTELGFDDHVIRINSIGDTDSVTRYSREISNFLRKRIDSLPPEARELMKRHALDALAHLIETDHELAYKSPNPLEHLSDQSRKHFRDIIEYLDMSNATYEIDPKMLGHHEVYSDALFAVSPLFAGTEDKGLTITGGRIDEFMYRKTKKRTPAAGSVAILNAKPAPSRSPRITLDEPHVAVIQLGFEPKIRTLMLLDELRKAGVTTHQDLANDSLSAQLRAAEELGVKYVIIMGQKEFIDGTVILRDMFARKQESIAPDQAIRKIKRGSPVAV